MRNSQYYVHLKQLMARSLGTPSPPNGGSAGLAVPAEDLEDMTMHALVPIRCTRIPVRSPYKSFLSQLTAMLPSLTMDLGSSPPADHKRVWRPRSVQNNIRKYCMSEIEQYLVVLMPLVLVPIRCTSTLGGRNTF